jgi:flagellar FliL protein
MSTQGAAAAPTAAPAVEGAAEKKSGWFWKLIVLGLIVAVIGAECLFAFVYVSMATDKAATAEVASATSLAPQSSQDEDGELEQASKEVNGNAKGEIRAERETDLGEYSLSAFQPASNTTLLIDFHLYGTLSAEDETGFAEYFEANKHRIRDQVITTIRSAELADLTDPGLGLIKRQILEKTNRALGKPLLQGIVFSDFLVVEQ